MLRILTAYLDHITAAIDYVLGKRVIARRKNASTATCKNILTSQVEQKTILNFISKFMLTNSNTSPRHTETSLYHLLCD